MAGNNIFQCKQNACHKVTNFDGKVGVSVLVRLGDKADEVSTQTHEQRNKTKIK